MALFVVAVYWLKMRFARRKNAKMTAAAGYFHEGYGQQGGGEYGGEYELRQQQQQAVPMPPPPVYGMQGQENRF